MREGEPPTRVLRPGSPPAGAALGKDPRGLRVGSYVVLELLGQGGMGAVYRAYHPQLDRAVALKLVLAEQGAFPSAEARERLLREAQAMARVTHPNIVKVHDVGTRGDDVFIAMDLVEGVTLKQWLREQTRSSKDVLRMFVAAGEGLAAAHDVGLVHRDFKPSNVLVDALGTAFVTDFGLARLVGGSSSSRAPDDGASVPPSAHSETNVLSTELTIAGTVVGTPAYMAPEQHRGEALDSRSDQFSFCVALFEALAGRRPYAGQRARELITNVVERRVRWDGGTRRIPRWLRPILTRGLAPEPWERFASMQALLDAISHARVRSLWIRSASAAALAGVFTLGAVQGVQAWRVAAACSGVGDSAMEIGGFPDNVPQVAGQRLESFRAGWIAARKQLCLEHEIEGARSAEAARRAQDCLDAQGLEVATLVERARVAGANLVVEASLEIPTPQMCLDRRNAAHAVANADSRSALADVRVSVALGALTMAMSQAEPLLGPQMTAADPVVAAQARIVAARASIESRDLGRADALALEAADLAEGQGLDRLAAQAWVLRAQAQQRMEVSDEGFERTAAFAAAALQRADAEAGERARLELAHAARAHNQGRTDVAARRARSAWQQLLHPTPGGGSSTIHTLELLGTLAGERGRGDVAAGLWLQVVARRQAALGARHPSVDRARRALERALAKGERHGDG